MFVDVSPISFNDLEVKVIDLEGILCQNMGCSWLKFF